ncbi:hypothetical protein ACVIRM_004563 [Rhizobium laguerreae]
MRISRIGVDADPSLIPVPVTGIQPRRVRAVKDSHTRKEVSRAPPRGAAGFPPKSNSCQNAKAFDVSGAEVASGPKSASPEICSNSCSRWRARLTRLLMVPTAQPQISAASS